MVGCWMRSSVLGGVGRRQASGELVREMSVLVLLSECGVVVFERDVRSANRMPSCLPFDCRIHRKPYDFGDQQRRHPLAVSVSHCSQPSTP